MAAVHLPNSSRVPSEGSTALSTTSSGSLMGLYSAVSCSRAGLSFSCWTCALRDVKKRFHEAVGSRAESQTR